MNIDINPPRPFLELTRRRVRQLAVAGGDDDPQLKARLAYAIAHEIADDPIAITYLLAEFAALCAAAWRYCADELHLPREELVGMMIRSYIDATGDEP
jgi:hypothetical protein